MIEQLADGEFIFLQNMNIQQIQIQLMLRVVSFQHLINLRFCREEIALLNQAFNFIAGFRSQRRRLLFFDY